MRFGIFLSALLAVTAVTGCITRQPSPEREAITATTVQIKSADDAITAWADYVVRARKDIEKLRATDVGAAMAANHDLLVREGLVSDAYYRYQDAAQASIRVGNPVPPGTADAFVTVVKSNLPTK